MHRFRSYIALLTIVTLAACTPDKREKLNEGAGNATFRVQDMHGSYAESGKVSPDAPWKVPTSVHVTFKASLKDNTTNQDIRKQDFYITAPGSSIGYKAQTTSEGLLQWEEDIPFNYFAGQSGWITLERVINGRGTNTGAATVSILVNPWVAAGRDNGKAVLLERDKETSFVLPKAEAHSFLAGQTASQGAAQLIITDVKIRAVPEAEGDGFVTYTYAVEMHPRIRTKKANGEYAYEDVADGDFNLWLQIMAAQAGPQMNKRAIVLGGEPFTVGKVVDGKLRAELSIRQERRANQGSLELAMKVTPRTLSSLATIRPWNGIYRLGNTTVVDDDNGSIKSICLEENTGACDYARAVETASNYNDLVKAGYIKPNQRYVFSNLRLRFLMVQPGETATQRTVAYTASTCITDMATGKSLANTPMLVRYLKKPDQHAEVERDVIEKSTDDSGCLNWDGLAFHKYYQPEEYFTREISVEKASGFKENFKFFLNPWDTNINFGFDQREFTPEKIQEITGRRKIPSRFFLGGYSYHTVRFLYNVDPFMDLEVKKTVLMELVPEVLRYSGIKDARKMTEHLRDGIYLLKVAIQKSYLDPRDNSHLLVGNKNYQAEMETVGGRQLATKEYITTNTVLVRVVSGLIIVPIELTMRDLRLMRVRSNFILQLETVDERMIQAYHVFKKHAIDAQDLATKLRLFRATMKATSGVYDVEKQILQKDDERPTVQGLIERQRDHGDDVTPYLLQSLKDREAIGGAKTPEVRAQAIQDLQSRVDISTGLISASLKYLKQRLESGGPLGTYLNSSGKDTQIPAEVLRDASIIDNFELNPGMLSDLKTALNINDFSEVTLPPKEEIDPNIFIEQDSGLKKRSFVGPVIFLSNAYSDSARATDNLDEAGCTDPEKTPDAIKLSREELVKYQSERAAAGEPVSYLFEKGRQMSGAGGEARPAGYGNDSNKTQATPDKPGVWLPETELEGRRQNNAYTFNKYFGSLSHLCYSQVDDLIAREKVLNERREDTAIATSLKSNFIDFVGKIGIDLKFVSLTDEPLVRLNENCTTPSNIGGEGKRPRECLETTTENTVSVATLHKQIDQSGAGFAPENYSKLFFERTPESRAGLCGLLTTRFMEKFKELRKKKRLSFETNGNFADQVRSACMADNGLIQDLKYHVNQTGNYMFLGGLNLNINVGESFSTSWSNSWGAGFEPSDLIGVAAATGNAAAGLAAILTKPFSLKYGISQSESNGTSISESTYLVSQIAGFQLDLTRYEKCAVVTLSPQAMRDIRGNMGERWDKYYVRKAVTKVLPDTLFPQYMDADFNKALRSGLMVCEGATRESNPVKSVKESYFYFTQHFTEGDMLDQADLYNHPWLLAMRGMRDFVTFSNRVRAQEVVGLGPFLKGVLGMTPEKNKAWALNHMTWIYENVLPSFPGFYTVLEQGEDIKFLLEQAHSQAQMTKIDTDPLGEVTRRALINPGVSQQGITSQSTR